MGNAAEKKRIAASYKRKSAADLKEEQNKAKTTILGIAGGGTLVSAYFFKDNLARLFIKVSSGGADAGYGRVPVKQAKRVAKGRGRAAVAEPPKKSGPFGLF